MSMSTLANANNELARFGHLFKVVLPTEMRDEVYGYLWEDVIKTMDYGKICEQYKKCVSSAGHGSASPCSCGFPAQVPWFVQTRNVGRRFAYEAVLWLYSNHPGWTIRNDMLDQFLQTDVFHVGVCPGSLPMRSITIEFSLRHAFVTTLQARTSVTHDYDIPRKLQFLPKVNFCRDCVLQVNLIEDGPDEHSFSIMEMFRIMKNIRPIVAELEQTADVKTEYMYLNKYLDKVDIKHLKDIAADRWILLVERILLGKVARVLADSTCFGVPDLIDHLNAGLSFWGSASDMFVKAEKREQFVKDFARNLTLSGGVRRH